MEDYYNAGGYGFWCGKRCAEKKREQGIRPKFWKKNKLTFDQEQEAKRIAEMQARQAAEASGSKSKAPLIIGAVLVVGILATVVVVKMRKK